MRRLTACIFGSCGSVGYAAAGELRRRGFRLRLSTRQAAKNDKIFNIARDADDIVCLDVTDFAAARRFCRGADVVIGAAGPSFILSEAMFAAACAEKVPYVDPGGGFLISKGNLCIQTKITGVLDAGVFPGLSGLLMSLILEEIPDQCRKMVVAVGGRYSFTKAAAADFAAESQAANGGIPMACIREGIIVPAQKAELCELPLTVRRLKSFPYLSGEIQRIARRHRLCSVDSYTLVEAKVFNAIAGISTKEDDLLRVSGGGESSEDCSVILVRYETNKSVFNKFFLGDEPGKVSGVISALAALHVVRGQVSPGLHYCSDVFVPKYFMKILRESMVFRYEESEQRVRPGIETGTLL